MANKNTKRRNDERAENKKAGAREMTFDRVYVQKHGNSYRNVTISVPHDESANPRRNTVQRVLKNSGGGASSSLTVHEALDKTAPVRFKNHGYMVKDEHGHNNYRQPSTVRGRA